MNCIDPALLARATALSSATLHEAAGRIGALPSALKPLAVTQRICGPALPVRSPAGDNLWLHRAVYAANPGEVLVADVSGGVEFGYWGEVLAVAAQARGVAGLVITGGVRDVQRMVELGFPVFSAAICIQGTGKNAQGAGSVGQPVMIGSVRISRGDLVLGDADGVVAIPAGQLGQAVDRSEERDAHEREVFGRLSKGESTLSIYGLPGGEDWRR